MESAFFAFLFGRSLTRATQILLQVCKALYLGWFLFAFSFPGGFSVACERQKAFQVFMRRYRVMRRLFPLRWPFWLEAVCLINQFNYGPLEGLMSLMGSR